MTKPKKVKTVAEVTGGELLSNEDRVVAQTLQLY